MEEHSTSTVDPPTKPDKYTQAQKDFIRIFAETDNKVTAYKQAGYKWDDGKGKRSNMVQYISQLLRRPKIQRGLALARAALKGKREEKESFDHAWVRDQHARLAKECETAGDRPSTFRHVEAIGKMCGAYGDNASRIDITVKREYSEREQAELEKLADMRILESVSKPSRPTISEQDPEHYSPHDSPSQDNLTPPSDAQGDG